MLSNLTSGVVEKFLFFPVKIIEFYPSQLEMPFEEVSFYSQGKKLHGWFFKGKRPLTLLYFHGNAGNIGDRLDKIQLLRRFGWNIFIFDYQGYGGSEGQPSLEGVVEDSRSALKYLMEFRHVPNTQIVLFGESLGGAMATVPAHEQIVAGVILESTFTSLRDITSTIYKIVPSMIVPDAFRSIDLIRHIKSPVMVIHGEKDEIVPFDMGKKLFESAPHPKRFFGVPSAHHNDVYLAAKVDYLRSIEDFLSVVEVP